MKMRRRSFILSLFALMGISIASIPKKYFKKIIREAELLIFSKEAIKAKTNSDIFISRNGTPQENVHKTIEMMGGIEKFICVNDIVILKPNGQWWNQGRTNLAAMKGFIDLVLNIPGFNGEVIIAENQHFMDDSLPEKEKDNVRGWVEYGKNNNKIDGVKHNLNTLIELYQNKGIENVTKNHWRDGGGKNKGACGNGQNGGLVNSPKEGDGYVWSDIEYIFTGYFGFKKWPVKMTYPIFTSTYSGITIDLKNGAFLRDGQGGGRYLHERPIKLINFPAVNSHGWDTGLTSAVKNYMGITDLSCGSFGLEPKGYYNIHNCGGEEDYPFAKAGPIGHFMKTIRKADLNIVTAEWVGWGSRTDVDKATRTRTILAGTDPIALDYYSAKYLLFPLAGNKNFHDPDYTRSRIRQFLELARKSYGEGVLDERNIRVRLHDFSHKSNRS